MIKTSVKKPFTVLVAVIMVLVLGVVSLTSMTTDLLPPMSLPYLIVVTTYPGASPEKVEAEVVRPMESALHNQRCFQCLFHLSRKLRHGSVGI